MRRIGCANPTLYLATRLSLWFLVGSQNRLLALGRGPAAPIGNLRIGETLKTLNGTTIVESIVRRPEGETVYNIEAEGDVVKSFGIAMTWL
jgi:hypothetical protein